MGALLPIDQPALAPLDHSADFDQLEADMKASFMVVFESMIRPRERQLNLYGMAHLGEDDLLQRSLKADGLAVIQATTARLQLLLKAWRARNPERGALFLRTYLQALWPNQCKIEQLWMPIASQANYPAGLVPTGDPATHFLTSRLRVTVSTDTDNGTGLAQVAKALRSVLPARLLLEMKLYVNTGNSFGVANGLAGIMPMFLTGTLKNQTTNGNSMAYANGAAGVMPLYLTGTLS